MPAGVDHELALRQAKALHDLYADATARMLNQVARRLARGIDQPGWAELKLLEIARLRDAAAREVHRLEERISNEVARAVNAGHTAGQATAAADLQQARISIGFATTNTRTVDALIAETVTGLRSTHTQILRATLDAYRSIIAETAAGPVTSGVLTRRQAAQQALNRFADSGIGGFVDSAGRRWRLESYAEMATRTAVGRAQVQGTLGKYVQAGRDLVIVSDAPEECALCRPWEGRVLSITGSTPTLTTVAEGFEVAGTVDQAIGAGLQHPNCRHRMGLFVPGLTKPMHGTADPQGDRDRQQQRYLERGVRQWKHRSVASLDPATRARSDARVRDWQARLRQHVHATDGKRLRYREQVRSAI